MNLFFGRESFTRQFYPGVSRSSPACLRLFALLPVLPSGPLYDAGYLPSTAGFSADNLQLPADHLPIICRDGAAADMVMSNSMGSARMGAETDYGKRWPNGGKIVELRKEKGLKQQALAETAQISERLLRDIERKNHPVPTTTITAIAAALRINSSDITLSTPDASPTKGWSLLKLRAVRSATELSTLAERAKNCRWRLKIDPARRPRPICKR